MDNITFTKVALSHKDNYQKYSIPIIDKDFLDISLEHVKKDILVTLINVCSKFNPTTVGRGQIDPPWSFI